MRLFEHTNFDFVGNRHKAYILSAVLMIASLISLVVRGVEVGIDFQGGMSFVIETDQPIPVGDVRSELADQIGIESEVKTYGQDAILIRTAAEGDITEVQEQILQTIQTAFPDSNPTVAGTDIVGPRFAEDLERGAVYSVIGSLLVIFVYILIRFEWRFGFASVAALFHDVLITLGLFSMFYGIMPFSLQIDQTIIAAFLTLIGYGINDTVVIFDRIREYMNMLKTEPFPIIVNRAINSTLSRTIVTGGTTLLSVIVLFIFGGEVLRGFAFALAVGIVVGTYSSVFVAPPILIELREREAKRAVTSRR